MKIQKGKIQRAQRAVIYGPEGVGKSTLASKFPAPVFLDLEEGTHHLDVARIEAPGNWEEISSVISQLAGQHEFKTLVLDTADWLEKRLTEHICRKANKESIEDFGYGKGYVILAEEFAKFLASLDALIKRGMHVVFLAHSTVRKFELPDQAGSFDRYELKLSKQVAPLLKEWADLILFCNYVTKIAETDGRRRAVGGRERVLYTCHTAAWDAKNRHGLDEKLPCAWESIAHVFGSASASAQPAPEKTTADRLAEIFAGKEDAVRSFLVSRGQIKEGGAWSDIPADYARRILDAPEKFMSAVAKEEAK